ncbi:sigma-70 family RNA polymerase sigma factor [Gemmata sp. JC673]|uniref:Sigma-70 family RNA polymerase sigma factor n=1 Tax=Gemmata algarum TaxID=2975278 RepID=A0ABU5EWL1_9BACT|nr:sigma-70 family RNA polymerase sigma factor [Gemmata algarum]MDY3559520.1 sigma-70 family RNA polymerase sigma factor [Gemmata algarum]
MPTLRRVVLGRQTAARTDGELLTAFVASASGDAFAELVRRHGPMVLGVCRRLIPDHATADDAFQAVFLVLARRAAGVRPRERVGAYLYGIAYRTALKARMVLARRRSREKQVEVMPEPPAPPAAPAWGDVQFVIDEELARLPEKLRIAVVLCDLEGRPQREVARQLGVPPATLATRLAAARRSLAARLTRRGVTLSGGALAGLLVTHASASAVPHALAAGVARAAEAVAAGGAVGAAVSAQAVQLSEGVMQMMMLAKLKAVTVVAAVALVLTTGLGVGLAPAAAGEEPVPVTVTVATPAPDGHAGTTRPKERAQAEPAPDDALFLRRLSLDVRGTVPTPVETWFFVSDTDAEKRAKVIEWITDDEDRRAAAAKKLGVPVERVRVARAKFSADGRSLVLIDPIAIAKPTDAIELVSSDPAAVTDARVEEITTDVTVTKTAQGVVYDVKSSEPGAAKTQPPADATKKTVVLRRVQADAAKSGSVFEYHGEYGLTVWDTVPDDKKPQPTPTVKYRAVVNVALGSSDAEFLKRVLTDARGTAPTALELKYFTEDKDPKKREKLLDTLLKEPAVAKKLGDEWKKKMLAPGAPGVAKEADFFYFVTPNVVEGKSTLDLKVQPFVVPLSPDRVVQPFVVPLPPGAPKPPAPPKPPTSTVTGVPAPPKPPAPPAPPVTVQGTKVVVTSQLQSDKLEKLVGELIAAQKSDDALLEAVTLATQSRLPTDAEKKLTKVAIGVAADRKTAWVAIARALAGTEARSKDVLELKVVPSATPKPAKP